MAGSPLLLRFPKTSITSLVWKAGLYAEDGTRDAGVILQTLGGWGWKQCFLDNRVGDTGKSQR